jgi:hypothetical protein
VGLISRINSIRGLPLETGAWLMGPTFDHMRIWMSSISINSIISWILGDETLLVNARPAESTARDLFLSYEESR